LLHSDKIVKTERDKRVQQFLVKKAWLKKKKKRLVFTRTNQQMTGD
jgi:hypothetical protein